MIAECFLHNLTIIFMLIVFLLRINIDIQRNAFRPKIKNLLKK